MFGVLTESAPERTRSLSKRGLTPNDSRALFTLDREVGRTMRSLATAWGCDPSNATWIVDRLERLGLAERRSQPGDRRVRLVALTARGLETRAALLDEFHRPPQAFAALGSEDLATLHRILGKLAAAQARVPKADEVLTRPGAPTAQGSAGPPSREGTAPPRGA